MKTRLEYILNRNTHSIAVIVNLILKLSKMQFDESIYNLIPKEQFVPEKGRRYKSQYPSNLAPTASTFGLGTTSKPQCSNLSGKFNLEGGKHSHLAGGATFGQAKGALKPETTGFRKKGTGQPVLVPKTEGKSLETLVYGCWWLLSACQT